MNATELSDLEFLRKFEACELSNDCFHHRDHIRLAWIYLQRYGELEALGHIAGAIRKFAAHHGKSDKYHETVTVAWLRLLANAMAEEDKPLGQLVADLQREFGPHYYGRRDLHIPEEMKQNAIQRARSERTQTLGRYKVLRKEHMDGVKFFLDAPANRNGADAWVLFRASGTEPLLRLYSEASSTELVNELLGTGEQLVKSGA